MITIRVKKNGFDEFNKFTAIQRKEIEKNIPRMIRGIVRAVLGEVKRLASGVLFNRRTGAYIAGIDTGAVVKRGNRWSWSYGNIAPHAHFLEHGTAPHFIFPKKEGGVLRWESGGEVHFARWVIHPGTKAYAPFEKAHKNKRSEADEIVERQIENALVKAINA